MKNLVVALLCLFSASTAFANAETNKNALQIVKRIELKQKRIKKQLRVSQSLIKILGTEDKRQGDAYSLYFQSNTEITGTNSLIDLTVDGSPATLEQPAQGLFIYHSNGESEIKTHAAVAKLSIEDTAEAKSLRDAVLQLDTEIATLNEQIDEMEPGNDQDALIAQRDEKIAIKNQLVAALAAIKTPIGEEAFTFRIIGAIGTNPSFFRILSVSPSFGPVEGGTELTVTGQRFPTGMEAILGGVTVPVTYVSPTEVRITTPDFTFGANGGAGIKSLELRKAGATPQDPVKNATRTNVFFAANITAPPTENIKPVAVAGASQSINMGTEATLSGAASYDSNPGDTITYSWKAISVPAGSGISTGVVHATTETFDFTPSKPGAYVWELIVNDGEFDSEPSLTVVTANPPTNSAPEPTADGISVATEASATTQVVHGDEDTYQAHTYLITKQSAFGTASISSTGLLSFEAGETAGSDTIEVAVVDNGNPPFNATVSIPVSVVASEVTLNGLFYNVIAKDGLITVQLGADTISSSNGTIVSAVWSFGDGTSQPSLTPAIEGSVRHDYLAAGTYTASVLVTDSLGATATASQTVTIGASDMPVVKVAADVISGSVPLTVNFDASASSDDVGISSFRYRWFDSTSDTTTTSTSVSHTFNTAGTYRVRIRAVDADGNRTDAFVDIFAGVTPPSEGSHPFAFMNVGSREVALTSAHAFSGLNSFDPNPSGSIAAYNWNFSDFLTCDWSDPNPGCVATGSTVNYTFPEARNYSVSLSVEGALGGASTPFDAYKEVYAVNAGHAPRSVPIADVTAGAEPLTVNFNGSGSFDYEGAISSYSWDFGDAACTTGCTATTANASYTYASSMEPYYATLTVTDSDGNKHVSGVGISVDPSLAAKEAAAKSKKLVETDPDREQLRRELTQRCFVNRHGASCYEVGKMYQEDSNSVVAAKYFAKACAYGYEAACSRK